MEPQAPRQGRGPLLFLGKLCVSSALLAFLFWKVDRATFIRTLQVLPPRIFLGCLGLYVLSYLISTFRWQRLLLAEGIRLPLWRLAIVYLQGAFFNLFLPTLIGGDIFRGYAIYKITRGNDASVASILVDRLSGFAALIVIALAVLGLAYPQIRDPQVAIMILAVAATFALLLAALLHDSVKERASGVLRVVGLTRFQAKFQGLVNALHRYRGHRRALGQAFLLSGLLQALIIFTYYLIGAGLNLGVPIAYFFLYVPLITFVAMLPVSVAGLGVREWGAVFFFAKVGVDGASALSMSLAWFSLSLIMSSLGGLAFLLHTHTVKRVWA
jgi:glycosyltransferase 2 family protein